MFDSFSGQQGTIIHKLSPKKLSLQWFNFQGINNKMKKKKGKTKHNIINTRKTRSKKELPHDMLSENE